LIDFAARSVDISNVEIITRTSVTKVQKSLPIINAEFSRGEGRHEVRELLIIFMTLQGLGIKIWIISDALAVITTKELNLVVMHRVKQDC
jgi:hypothetical protein